MANQNDQAKQATQTNQLKLKPLKGKQLDKVIALAYQFYAAGRTINILDIPKVYSEARAAYAAELATSGDATSATRAMDAAIVTAVQRYCNNLQHPSDPCDKLASREWL